MEQRIAPTGLVIVVVHSTDFTVFCPYECRVDVTANLQRGRAPHALFRHPFPTRSVMVYLTRDRYEDAYDKIKQDSLKGTCLIFVAPDVDALCSAKILQASVAANPLVAVEIRHYLTVNCVFSDQSLLKADYIAHKVVPVSGYTDLSKANQNLIENNEELRTIVMLNCGGLVDLSEFFTLSPEVTLYVIDSHRPHNLHNVFGSGQIVVLDDGNIEDEMQNEKKAFEEIEVILNRIFICSLHNIQMGLLTPDSFHVCSQYDEDSEEDSDDDDDVDVDDREEREENRVGHARDDSENEDNDRPRQRRKTGLETEMSTQDKRLKRRQNRRQIANYYSSGTYYGQSVAGQIYTLASQLARTSNELLWLAIIGLTSQYIFEHIDRIKYTEQVQVFRDEVTQFNIRPSDPSSSDIDNATTSTSAGSSPDDVTIRFEDEYRFMLFRHWSLYESMFHSSYVASKLGIWREKGKKKLMNLLAKMGFSLQQSREAYTHMDIDLKKMLRSKIESIAPHYGLLDICYSSFHKSHGFKCQISASDAVYALAALLEASPEVATRLGAKVEWKDENMDRDKNEDNKENNSSDENGLNDKEQRRSGSDDNWWLRNFYTAYDALGSVDRIQSGLYLCMALQRAIVRQGTSLIDKQNIKTLKTFRWAIIRDGPDLAIFTHPLTLSKLALFLVDAYRVCYESNIFFIANFGTSRICRK
ncbi:CDC45-like protein-domain-containing protein [Endogone sp. FLAS-F59071]|nr:CDC45-like protein-domain-containing protein [Endogone sp. FLAS-F59071]|eukprot:RUS21570.1 CDC45-like protein-domain-containing protein [Endogone sp. FLAS-F59071]